MKREDLEKAHPEIQLDYDRPQVRKAVGRDRMIFMVQERLENEALSSAIVADCKPVDNHAVSNCGLYYYERGKSAVSADSQRIFTVPVTDPSKWSEHLAEKLYTGIAASRQVETNRAIDDFVGQNTVLPTEEAKVLTLGLQPGVYQASTKQPRTASVLRLYVGTEQAGNRLSLYLSGTQGEGDRKGLNAQLKEVGTGLAFDLRARALKTLTWTLNFQAGWQRSQFKLGTESPRTDENLVFGFGPGLSIDLIDGWAADFNYTIDFLSKLKHETPRVDSADDYELKGTRQRVMLGVSKAWY